LSLRNEKLVSKFAFKFNLYRYSEEGKVGAPAAALILSNLLSSFGMMFGYMPILALAAQSAPPGLEAFGFSMLLFTADLVRALYKLHPVDTQLESTRRKRFVTFGFCDFSP
jgi:hypothetical protein